MDNEHRQGDHELVPEARSGSQGLPGAGQADVAMIRTPRSLRPPRVINIDDLRRQARRRLPRVVFNYVDGGADDEVTLRENCRVFQDVAFRPRQAVAIPSYDLRTRVLGSEISFPALLAPIGYLRLIHPGGEIDAALRAKVGAGEIPGVVAMAASEQSVVYEGAFGVRNMAAITAMSSDTIFRIASMVKLLTSVAALQLVERGKLKLDEPAGNIDPTLGSAQVLAGFDSKGVPQLRPAQKPVTLRHLLTHTSGLSYPLWDPNVVRYLKIARSNPALPRMPLMFEPGARWAYGGSLDRVGRWLRSPAGRVSIAILPITSQARSA